MSETIDPITWLRDQITSAKPISLNPKTNELELDNSSIRIPKDAQTAWQKMNGQDYYTIGSLWLMLKMKDQGAGAYAKEAIQLNIKQVDFKDKRSVMDYFTGTVNESAQIDTAKRAQTLIKKSDIRSGTAL